MDGISKGQRVLAAAAYSGCMVFGIGWLFLPLLIWLVRHNDRFVAYHAKQAFLGQLFIVISGMLVMILLMNIIDTYSAAIVAAVQMIAMLLFLVAVGTIKALTGEYYRFPGFKYLGIKSPEKAKACAEM